MSGEIAIPQNVTPSTQAPQALPAVAAQADPIAAQAASKRPLVNPSLHLDLALNLVVLQFVDDKGDVTSSIPSEKQLKAYQTAQTGQDSHAGTAARPRAES